MKTRISAKKYALGMVVILLAVSALSVLSISQKNVKIAPVTLTNECVAQGDYMPVPFENTEYIPAQDNNDEAVILCGGDGDYKPKPLPKPPEKDPS